MKKLTKNQKISLVVVIAVLVIGGIIYYSQRNSGSNAGQNQENSSGSNSNSGSNGAGGSNGSSGGTGSNGTGGTNSGGTTGTTGGVKGFNYEVKELAIKFPVSGEIADLTYVISDKDPKTALFSSKSLKTAGGNACSASAAVLGSITWNQNISEPKRVPETGRFKQFDTEWVAYTSPNFTCGNNQNKAAQTLQQKQAEALLKAFQNVSLTSRVASSWAPKAMLAEKTWKWIHNEKGSNVVVFPLKKDAFTLTLKKDGSFSAKTDCNDASGKYVAQGDRIVFSNIAQTKMFCSGSQEAVFTEALSNAESYYFDSDARLVIKLKAEAGYMIFN